MWWCIFSTFLLSTLIVYWIWSFICTNWNVLYQKMLCSNFTWDCPYNAFGEEVFGHSQCISILPYHLPLEKGWHFKRINIEFLPQKGAFVKFVWNRLENQNYLQIFKQQQWQTTDKYWSEKLNWVFDSD